MINKTKILKYFKKNNQIYNNKTKMVFSTFSHNSKFKAQMCPRFKSPALYGRRQNNLPGGWVTDVGKRTSVTSVKGLNHP